MPRSRTRTVTCSLLLVFLLLLVGCSDSGSPNPAGCLSDAGTPLPLAPDSDRVDRGTPTFGNPLVGTNPLHPVSEVTSYVQLGTVGGQPFRAEVTLLPTTRTIRWKGQDIQVVESQYFAYIGGRIEEVAIDWYAQADDGGVWYLGEDVFNYADGVVADLDGTWLAGRDGPAGMIMPGNPQVGDVYRPENICGTVFEEVTVKTTGITVNGPRGPVSGAILVTELHQDGVYEDKTFAPGYGEFTTGLPGDEETLAIAVPIDAIAGAPPADLGAMLSGTDSVFDAALVPDWGKAAAGLSAITSAWNSYRAGGVPPLLDTQMTTALAALTSAVNAQQPATARSAAIMVARATHDFRLRYVTPTLIDRARFELWARQAQVDAAAGDSGGLRGDASTLEWIRDRFLHTLATGDQGQLNSLVAALRSAADAADLTAAAQGASNLRAFVASLP